MPISVKDLARLAGVSVSTVTRALQDKPDVNKRTRERVLELARIHHYRPNVLARSLVTSRTYTIGVIVPDLMNPFFPALIKGLESALWNMGYGVIFADTDGDSEKETQAVNDLISRRVDGIIISPTDVEHYDRWLQPIVSANVPVVSLTRLKSLAADTVVASDRYGARAAAEHLVNMGRTKILYIGNRASMWANSERESGIREALVGAGLGVEEYCVRSASDGTIQSAAEEVRNAIRSNCRFDAVIAFDDIMAIGVRAALSEAGKSVPKDVALVGFDNIELSALPEIDLTTVDIPKVELGRVSARLVVDRIEERAEKDDESPAAPAPFREVVMNTTLIIRGSTNGSMR